MASQVALLAVVLNVLFASISNGASLPSYRVPDWSARRLPGESYQRDPLSNPGSVEDSQVALEKVNILQIPELSSMDELWEYFEFVRGTRFVDEDSDFPRRLTWFFPDDGCHFRAEVAANKLIAKGMIAPMKVFAFGKLVVETENHPDGIVYWRYHVVPVYRVGEVAYVIDPSVYTRSPMTLNEWNSVIGGDEIKVGFSVCTHESYAPASPCFNNPDPLTDEYAEECQISFHGVEWDRLIDLGRNPEEELGDNPPWVDPETKFSN